MRHRRVSGSDRSRTAEGPASEGESTLANFLGTKWAPVSMDPRYGIIPLVVGSLKVTLLAILYCGTDCHPCRPLHFVLCAALVQGDPQAVN